MLKIITAAQYQAEKQYIFNVIFTEFLGIPFVVETKEIPYFIVELFGHRVILPDILFANRENTWLRAASLPKQPLELLDLRQLGVALDNFVAPTIPIIYGAKQLPDRIESNCTYCPIDIFGSAFFMLTRYEEVVNKKRDIYNRFPASASLAYQEGFLERPIINEYVEILFALLQQRYMGLKRKAREFQVQVSHGVDTPYAYLFANYMQRLGRLGKIVYKDLTNKNFFPLFNRLHQFWQTIVRDKRYDPYFTFSALMNLSEQYGVYSTFYFFGGSSYSRKDARYKIGHQLMRKLIRDIKERGHGLGLQGSFHAYCNFNQLKKEWHNLQSVFQEEGIEEEQWQVRQHYLRWQPITFYILDQLGFAYDNTLSFADHIGFRCGVCYEYSTFDLLKKRTLHLKERPLLIVDGSALLAMGLSYSDFIARAVNLKNICRKYQGIFTLLWNNTSFTTPQEREVYQAILAQ